ncbi:sensor histidine kinase [Aquimarina sp. 2201CG5-10]|uniref:sensor histidine kinase n=1 Tax=Aquimarina callyspongiae TaxID=3098150 RepID=UPI002AB39069|nr:histidine kinase [Aquimarina sp. 2201CG5-10]MDY8135954.1 histidine kinase [Aquimarina sp. 2201CG5-10]
MHFVYWIVILLYYISSKWPFEKDKIFLLEKMVLLVLVQIILTYIIIHFVVPSLLHKKKKLLFILLCVLLIYITYAAFTAIRCYYLLPKYPEVYKYRPPLVFEERITNGFAFLNNITTLIFPTIILIVINYYRQQKEIISLKEKKKSSELEALKNQLNPHFLFNTLNNLYVLSLKKSDKSPEVIERLSGILDYILFNCKDKYVDIVGEVQLLENYIALEKLRYGKRLQITFNHSIEEDVKIGPLLLLTFTENAFKHGVEEEIDIASIKIELITSEKEIFFSIENTIPTNITHKTKSERESIGLKNIEKQLKLLYATNNYILNINENDDVFKVVLKLKLHGV